MEASGVRPRKNKAQCSASSEGCQTPSFLQQPVPRVAGWIVENGLEQRLENLTYHRTRLYPRLLEVVAVDGQVANLEWVRVATTARVAERADQHPAVDPTQAGAENAGLCLCVRDRHGRDQTHQRSDVE